MDPETLLLSLLSVGEHTDSDEEASQAIDHILQSENREYDPWDLLANASDFFRTCERDELGHCESGDGGGGYEHDEHHVSWEELQTARHIARAKAAANPKPTKEEKRIAKEKIAELGANKFRRNLVGNTKDRAKRRKELLNEFGNGQHCPCDYCGLKIGEGTLEQDKIYTTVEGGRYRTNNLVPACSSCNKKRSDTKWKDLKW